MSGIESFDVVVLGCGPAGEKAAAQAAWFGRSVCVIEREPEPGGAGVHTGTLPSKTLRETALYLSGHRARDLYGVSVRLDDPRESVGRLIARKTAIAARASRRIRNNLDRHRVCYLEGTARFHDAHEIHVTLRDGAVRRVSGTHVVIATGSRPVRPPEIRIDEPDVYDSDEILAIERLPEHLLVIGAGVIGCEYACMFAALGVRVTLLDGRASLLPFLDEEMSERLRAAMERLGIAFVLGSRWTGVERRADGLLACGLADGRDALVADAVLFAAGRVGNSDGLGLEALGIVPDARGAIPVDAQYRTRVPHVFAVGDVIGFPALASTSMEQGRLAICHALGESYRSDVLTLLPYGIYTIPEVSFVGETEASLRARGVDYVVGRASYAENARGEITGDLEGLTKLLVHRSTRQLAGVHVIGERATELVHIGQSVMQLGGTVDALVEMVFNHPTLAESYKYAAYAALGALSASDTVTPARARP